MVSTRLKETNCTREKGPQIKPLTFQQLHGEGCGVTWGAGGGVSYHGEVPVWPARGNTEWISLNEK